jgi:hypothetical protein
MGARQTSFPSIWASCRSIASEFHVALSSIEQPRSLSELLTHVSAGWSEARFDGMGFTSQLAPFIGTNTGLALPSNTSNGWFFGGGTE